MGALVSVKPVPLDRRVAPPGVERLGPDEVRWACDPDSLGFQSTADLERLDGMIGQERAASLDFGVDVEAPGFNILVVGPPGTGRTSMALDRLRTVARERPSPPDRCYVYNFRDPYRPATLCLPSGLAPVFRQEMTDLVEAVRIEMPRVFQTEEYAARCNYLAQVSEDDQSGVRHDIEDQAQARGFKITRTPAGLCAVPLHLTEDSNSDIPSELPVSEGGAVNDARADIEDILTRATRQLHARQQKAREQLRDLNADVARSVVQPLIDDLSETYRGFDDVITYLGQVAHHMAEHFEEFRVGGQACQQPGSIDQHEDKLMPYRVNVVVTHDPNGGAPVIQESHPTYQNLFGRVEQRHAVGGDTTDFTMIKPGALHTANGGFLVLDVGELLKDGAAYHGLKRALQSGAIRIDAVTDDRGPLSAAWLDAESIEMNVKVALIGTPEVCYSVQDADPEFSDLFKVRAEFDTEMELNNENIKHYAQFIAARCEDESLLQFDCSAVARVLEESVRRSPDRRHLSTRFGEITDIVREAGYWAHRAEATTVNEVHVWSAIDERIRRVNLLERRIRDRIVDGTVLIDVDGTAIGRVNGLSVAIVGGYEFGQANLISVRTYPGREGVISIDREAKLTGPIHDKGAMILSGFMSGTFGGDGPLSLSATLAFEQSYWGVEGDSASSAEAYALLSSLSEMPLRQDLAVTGSVNQYGQVQAVGDVNQKVEGFFDLCDEMGLTGTQGVLLPAANAAHLALRRDVVKAIATGKFHIYTTTSIADGIELLTGVPSGHANAQKMRCPQDTVFGAVQARLASFGRRLHEGPTR